MSDPFIFVTNHEIAPGQLEAVQELAHRFITAVEASDAELVEYHFVVSEDGREVSNVQVHATSDSMEAYLPAVEQLIGEALEITTTTRIEVFGTPGPITSMVLEHNASQGVPVSVFPTYVDGLRRLAA